MLIIQGIALLLLLVMSMYLAVSETSITMVSPVTARRLADDKRRGSEALVKVLEQRSNVLGTIYLLVLLTQLAASSIAGIVAYNMAKGLGIAGGIGTAIATAIMTAVIFIYAEVAPKNYGITNTEKAALAVARSVLVLTRVLHPIVTSMIAVANASGRVFGIQPVRHGPFITEEELLTAMELGEEQGVIEEEEKQMIHHIFEFGDTVVREIMTPRPDMVSVPVTVSAKDAMDVILKEGHSRIPVYKDTYDNILGILYARDLMNLIAKGRTAESLDELIRPAIVVPETKRVSELLRELQQKKIHMAIVVDEYGSTAGLATIEDLLEEIVGEIYDEYDLEEQRIEKLDENNVRVDGRVSIDDINEFLGAELENQDVDTVGGLVLEVFGHIPKRGERKTFQNLTFKVEKVVKNRVVTVLITRHKEREIGVQGTEGD